MTKPQPTIKTLADFRRLGLIGQWFGELQLIGVGYPRWSSRQGRDIVCRLTCAQGHGATRSWRKLQSRRRPICSLCRLARQPRSVHVPNLTGPQLIEAIGDLEPARRLLLDALLADRRRIAGKQDTSDREMLKDAYTYVVQITDPEQELRDLRQPSEYETYGRSPTLRSPSLIYVETM